MTNAHLCENFLRSNYSSYNLEIDNENSQGNPLHDESWTAALT